ncbi:MAG: PCRF domain-containing protein, partial [Paracoccaceae bacterium]
MRAEIQNIAAEIEKSLELLRQRMDWETVPHRLEEFNARVEAPDLWDDPQKAQKLMQDRQALVDAVGVHDGIEQDLKDTIDLIELGELEDDEEVVKDAEQSLQLLAKKAAEKELEALLNGEADSNDTFLEVHSGAGGTESCDWASMLARMYVRW